MQYNRANEPISYDNRKNFFRKTIAISLNEGQFDVLVHNFLIYAVMQLKTKSGYSMSHVFNNLTKSVVYRRRALVDTALR